MRRRGIALILVLVLCVSITPLQASAEGEIYAMTMTVNGEQKAVRACDDSYAGNIYLSLTDLAAALSETEKQFRFERIVSSTDGEYFTITTHQPPVLGSGAGGAPAKAKLQALNLFRNRIYLDGGERKYYTYNPQNGDLYMSLVDVQLMLDMTFEKSGSALIAKPNQHFVPDAKALRDAGYFDNISSVYLADANTGEVFFLWNGYSSLPVASISKLLSYYILREAISAGEIKTSDRVLISENAAAIAKTPDGMVPMEAGTYVPFSELMEAMLVASSNESAVALAEHLCGSESAFVERMNSRARELELYSAEMYNCNGLPSFSDSNIPVKRQNRMNAADLSERIAGEVRELYRREAVPCGEDGRAVTALRMYDELTERLNPRAADALKHDARVEQRRDMLPRICGDIQHRVKALAPQRIAKLHAVTPNEPRALDLRSAPAVEHIHLVPRFSQSFHHFGLVFVPPTGGDVDSGHL